MHQIQFFGVYDALKTLQSGNMILIDSNFEV